MGNDMEIHTNAGAVGRSNEGRITRGSTHIVGNNVREVISSIAPENVRDVSAYESRMIPSNESSLPIPQRGITQFQELLNQRARSNEVAGNPNDMIPTAEEPVASPHVGGEQTAPDETHPPSHISVPSDQPDGEPDTEGINSLPTPTGTEVPIPSSEEDDNLQCVGLYMKPPVSSPKLTPVHPVCGKQRSTSRR